MFCWADGRAWAGPVFRTEDLMNLFRNAVIPSSTRAKSPPARTGQSPSPIPNPIIHFLIYCCESGGGRPPPDYGPYQGPGGGRPGRRY